MQRGSGKTMNRKKKIIRYLLMLALVLGGLTMLPSAKAKAANPYLPLWEHIPDGEPRVFEDPDNPGKQRVYIYGSHDIRRSAFCGVDIRVWSAPVEDLSDWRDEGPVFTYRSGGRWDLLYAPDIAEVIRKDGTKEYYLYPHSRAGGEEGDDEYYGPDVNRIPMVCKGSSPVGPFEPINLNEDGTTVTEDSLLGFDPGVWIEYITDPDDPDYDIGFRAYAYWGFGGSGEKSWACELDQNTMYSVRPGTKPVQYFIPSNAFGYKDPPGTKYPYIYPDENLDDFTFFEASSIRKIGNKYILVYSGMSGPEYGVDSNNSSLRYCYGDSPMGPWRSGGVLIDSRGPVPNKDGTGLETHGYLRNTHGSILEINGQWYVFYHRPTAYGIEARQSMVAPIKVTWEEKSVEEGGKVEIRAYDPYNEEGDYTWTAKGGNYEYTGAEVASEGFNMFGLDPYQFYSAGYAYRFGGSLEPTYDIWEDHMPINGIRDGGITGFKYFGFEGLEENDLGLRPYEGTKPGNHTNFNAFIVPRTANEFKINVWMDGPWDNATWNGTKLGEIIVPAGSPQERTKFKLDVSNIVDNLGGKHAIYLVPEGGANFDLIGVGFSSDEVEIEAPKVPQVNISIDGKPVNLPKQPLPCTLENGIVNYDTYQYDHILPAGTTEIPVVTASASDDKVKITVSQADSVTGTGSVAIVRFDHNGAVKTYRIPFSEESKEYNVLMELPEEIGVLERAADIIGDGIAIDSVESETPQEKADKALEALNANVDLQALGVEIEIACERDTYTVTLKKGAAVMTIPSFSIRDIEKFTVFLDACGGILGVPARFDIKSGQPVGNLPQPSRSGYTFAGWYTARTGGDRVDPRTTVRGDTVCYAHWIINKHTITFDPNGGTLGAAEKARQVDYGAPIGTLPVPSRFGYTFNGWYTARTGGNWVTAATMVKGEITVYAQWTANQTEPDAGPKKGSSFNAKAFKFKVTKQAVGNKPGAVQLVRPLKKKLTSAAIPAEVRSGSFKYYVESVGDRAFKKCRALKKVTIGKNVVKIGKEAFSGDGKLKMIKIQTKKLKSVGKNALKGIYKKARIKAPASKLKAYKKLLRKKGQKATVKITK
jgi:arabinoxylan arabinofuranohydrolase